MMSIVLPKDLNETNQKTQPNFYDQARRTSSIAQSIVTPTDHTPAQPRFPSDGRQSPTNGPFSPKTQQVPFIGELNQMRQSQPTVINREGEAIYASE